MLPAADFTAPPALRGAAAAEGAAFRDHPFEHQLAHHAQLAPLNCMILFGGSLAGIELETRAPMVLVEARSLSAKLLQRIRL